MAHGHPHILSRSRLAGTIAISLCLTAALGAQAPALPFRPGESLEYQVHVQRLGTIGSGRMWVEGPVVDRGVSTWRLRFDFSAGGGLLSARDHTSSWLNPQTLSITRYEKDERHLLATGREAVEIEDMEHRWTDAQGPGGTLGSLHPLDELSFIYFLRTLPLSRDTMIRFDRHYDADRNPTIVRSVANESIVTPIGTFRSRVVEMQVRDARHYQGTGTIRIHLEDGPCHVPVRIESRVPRVGITTLTLSGATNLPHNASGGFC